MKLTVQATTTSLIKVGEEVHITSNHEANNIHIKGKQSFLLVAKAGEEPKVTFTGTKDQTIELSGGVVESGRKRWATINLS